MDLALQPMLQAERDRQFLKRLVKNREWETELMKDVPGWEVGTYWGTPVIKGVKNKFPYVSHKEYYMHTTKYAGKHEVQERQWYSG